MELEGLGTVFLGAPEMLWILRSQKPERPWRGSRVLVLALSQEKLDHHKPQKPSDIQALALLEILDPIREGAAETLDYLRFSGSGPKIICSAAHENEGYTNPGQGHGGGASG